MSLNKHKVRKSVHHIQDGIQGEEGERRCEDVHVFENKLIKELSRLTVFARTKRTVYLVRQDASFEHAKARLQFNNTRNEE